MPQSTLSGEPSGVEAEALAAAQAHNKCEHQADR